MGDAQGQGRKPEHALVRRINPPLYKGEYTMNEVISLIQQLGFPIACVIALFWKSVKDGERHKLESDEFVKAINNNTLVIQKLVDNMEGK